MMRRIICLALLAIGASMAAAAHAEDDIRYRVKRGDTLIAFGQEYLVRPLDYRLLQQTNKIANPRTLPIGKVLVVPRSLLKYKSATARLVTVRGQVVTLAGSISTLAKAGATLSEGQSIQTGPASSAALILEDGTRVSLPSNSLVKILRLRRYVLNAALDDDLQVDRGQARSQVAPLKSSDDRYRVRTPRAVSAVRGTDFQTRFDDASDRDFAEVDEGALAVGLPGGKSASLPAGNGLAVNADGSSITEAMLPPVILEQAGRLQSDPEVKFDLSTKPPVAAALKLTVAADAGFVDQVADLVTADNVANFGALPDGKYFVRVRAIAASGIEGLPATYAFKRRLNNVKGSAGATDDGWAFKWDGAGSGVIRYHFQLFRGATDRIAMIDEPALEAGQVTLSDLAPDTYFWRVGAVQYSDGESSTNWTPFEKIIVSAD